MRRRTCRLALAILTMLLIPDPAGATWLREPVDPVPGYNTDVAVDSHGAVHIVYTDYSDWNHPCLKYATNRSGAWEITILDPAGGRGSIAVDSADDVHVTYWRRSGPDAGLVYATNASGSWVGSLVDPAGDVSSIAVDGGGMIHVAYHYADAGGIGLKYASGSPAAWSITLVEAADATTNDVGGENALALDASGHAHISYYVWGPADLKYATNASESWVKEVVDGYGYEGMYNAIAVDSTGAVHVSYYDNNDGTIAYATNGSGAWVITKHVNGGAPTAGRSGIAVAPNGDVHIAVLETGYFYGFRHIARSSGTWIEEAIDDDGLDGSIAVDANGAVHAAYHHAENNAFEIRYATNAVVAKPEIAVDPPWWDFGLLDAGAASAASKFTVANGGSADLKVGTVGLVGPDAALFTIDADGCTNATLPPGGACDVKVSFHPDSSGLKWAFVSIPSNDVETPLLSVPVSGTGARLEVISPNGGEVIPTGSIWPIQWDAPAGAATFRLWYSMTAKGGWKSIGATSGTSFSWTVPAVTRNMPSCFLKVQALDAKRRRIGWDVSDAAFTLEVVRLTAPNGGESLKGASVKEITWTAHATKRPVARVLLSYSIDGGARWSPIAAALPGNPGRYDWTVPSVAASGCLVKVDLRDAKGKPLGSDSSDGVFSIGP